MSYLITDARYNKKSHHLIVENGKIKSQRRHIKHVKLLRMSFQSFNMKPGKVYYSSDYFSLQVHSEKKDFFISLLKRGYTSLVVSYKVSYLNQLKMGLEKARHELINCPIDYMIGVTINASQLTPQFVRACIRLNIPLLIVEMNHDNFISTVSWEWIRNQNFPIPVCIIPSWLDKTRFRKQKRMDENWRAFAHHLDIHTTTALDDTLNVAQLKALGAYPQKGIIHQGSDLDYNLYATFQDGKVDEETVSHYDNDIPNIVTLRGKIMKVNETIYFRPGYGREIKSAIPGRFKGFS